MSETSIKAPTAWTVGKSDSPLLTIYIPTFQRPELADLLAALAPQLTQEVEVIVSDNDGSAEKLVAALGSPCRVSYVRHPIDIGGDANIVRGFSQGAAPWVWVIGDDDVPTADAVQTILRAICASQVDRLILLSNAAPRRAAGVVGTIAQVADRDPGLPLAATLISANVVRREAFDLALAEEKLATKYGHAWGYPTDRIHVLPEPCLARVGYEHAGQGIPDGWDGTAIKTDYLQSLAVPIEPALNGWNYMQAQYDMEMRR